MRVLWAPWRMSYIEGEKEDGCFLCVGDGDGPDREKLALFRDSDTVVILNRYPYGNGHLMVAPRRHVGRLDELCEAEFLALMLMVKKAASALEAAYRPQGMNIGINLGKAAGAGVEDHLHWHLLPRWLADTNFMPLVSETKVIPEHLLSTYDRLLPFFEKKDGSERG